MPGISHLARKVLYLYSNKTTTMNNLSNKEALYVEAKDAYYAGEPLMSDADFDILEQELKDAGSSIVEVVGTVKAQKANHPTKMLSLGKISVYDDANLPQAAFEKWASQTSIGRFEETPKYDGNAINLVYRQGKLSQALTRGNGKEGFDIINKISKIVPNEIDLKEDLVEIRGEVVIKVATFDAKYSQFKNPRNFVAGILSRDDNWEAVNDFSFLAFELKVHSNGDYKYAEETTNTLDALGFERPYATNFYSVHGFSIIYENYLNYRENKSPYQLDGIVIKLDESERKEVGYTDHHPKWAVAIKFPPKDAITEIESIEWNTGTSGEIVPTAVMKPLELDGTTVRKATLFNWGKVQEMKAFPGAQVLVAKAGDIIPQIYSVVKESENYIEPPHVCPSCKQETEIDGIHVWCHNVECEDQVISRINSALQIFKIENVGGATIKKLYDSGFKSIKDYFGPNFNKEHLISTGNFKEGRALDIILENVNGLTETTVARVIMACGIKNLGWSAAKQLEKHHLNHEADFKGLNRSVIAKMTEETVERQFFYDLLDLLRKRNVSVNSEYTETESNDSIYYEMTGSPKSFGFKTKAEFVNLLKTKAHFHHKINDNCKYLVTDSYDSSSSKMKTAEKKGIEIITYGDLLKKLEL